jgi:hypothetical protein
MNDFDLFRIKYKIQARLKDVDGKELIINIPIEILDVSIKTRYGSIIHEKNDVSRILLHGSKFEFNAYSLEYLIKDIDKILFVNSSNQPYNREHEDTHCFIFKQNERS